MAERTGKPEKISLDGILGGGGPAVPPRDDDAVIEIVSEAEGAGGDGDTGADSGPGPATRSASFEDDPGAAQVEELLKEAMAEKERLNDLYLRARADLDNLRKRMERERDDARTRAGTEILREILPGLDNLDRALAQPDGTPGFREGVALIRRQIGEGLRKLGMEPIDALGEPFDPVYHEAITAEPREGLAPNTIIEEICKGYVFGGRVLRPSMVKVVTAPAGGAGSRSGREGAGQEQAPGGSVGPDHRD
jgi:molecular chaperone GrpE